MYRLGFSRLLLSSPWQKSLLAGYAIKCHPSPIPVRKYQQEQHRGYSADDSSTMPINIILTGATGTAGAGVLRQAIADPEVGRITVLTRRPLDTEHEKLKVIIHKDFNNYEDIASELGDNQAALWCLGISQRQVTKEQYDVITYDYTMAAAKAFGAANPNESFKFLFLTGLGADSTEKSSLTFARVKGKTENALAKLGHPMVVSFRPAYIHPDVHTKTSIGTKLADLLAVPAYKFVPSIIVNAADLGKGMLEVAKYGSDKQILSNAEIRKLANQYSARSSGAKA
ncbi:unnamed protein product [Calypogeia fissa]